MYLFDYLLIMFQLKKKITLTQLCYQISLDFLLLILITMRRLSNSQGKGNEKKGKKPVTNQEKAVFFINKLMDSIAGQIEKGKIEINPQKQEIKYLKNQKNTIEKYVGLSMQSIEQNLKQLRSSILQQKKEQQSFDKIKLLQAKELVAKMKKQKQEHKRKMIETQTKRTLHSRIFSQSTITRMKQKLEERVVMKKREIQQRINNIIQRKNERNKQLGKQIQYLEKVKELNVKAKSNIKLPSLFNPQENQERLQKLYIPRKNSLDYLKLNLAKTPKLNKLIPAKIKIRNAEQFPNSHNFSQQNYSNIIDKNIESNAILLTSIPQTNQPQIYKKSQQNHNLSSFIGNKSKIYGDEYLKESILKIKKSNISLKIETQESNIQENLQLQAQEATLNKNQKLQKLEQQWKRLLSRIQHSEINQQQGLDLLNSIERRLDKIDKEGIRNRLKKKCQVFDRIQFEIEPRSFGLVSGSNTN